jgi:cytochrome c oxidase cbb3-type subunit 3
MQIRSTLAAATALLLTAVCVRVAAQNPPPGAAQPAGRGGGRQGQGFPAGQRKPADPAVVERGKTIYGVNCRLCHGADLRGGDMGGINLMRSQLVLTDQEGELIYPVVKSGRNTPGMPPMPPLPLQEADVKAVAAYIHSVAATKVGQAARRPLNRKRRTEYRRRGAAAGKRYFDANCASCHSATGDLAGVAARYGSPTALQTAWVAGGGGGGRGGRGAPAPAPREPKPVTVTITTADGQKVDGRLDRIDDFIVSLTQADGTPRTFTRHGAVPAVDIHDPLDGHKKLLVKYTDSDIHDVTAYLVTLK